MPTTDMVNTCPLWVKRRQGGVGLCLASGANSTKLKIIRINTTQSDRQACQECRVKIAAGSLALFWAAAQPQGAATQKDPRCDQFERKTAQLAELVGCCAVSFIWIRTKLVPNRSAS